LLPDDNETTTFGRLVPDHSLVLTAVNWFEEELEETREDNNSGSIVSSTALVTGNSNNNENKGPSAISPTSKADSFASPVTTFKPRLLDQHNNQWPPTMERMDEPRSRRNSVEPIMRPRKRITFLLHFKDHRKL
jgi:hypothetical protein